MICDEQEICSHVYISVRMCVCMLVVFINVLLCVYSTFVCTGQQETWPTIENNTYVCTYIGTVGVYLAFVAPMDN